MQWLGAMVTTANANTTGIEQSTKVVGVSTRYHKTGKGPTIWLLLRGGAKQLQILNAC